MGPLPSLSSQPPQVRLDDKWSIDQGRILLSGTQAIVRVLLAQKAFDTRQGLNTAGFVSGYRGSPLGSVDSTLWSIADRLAAADIRFQPGVNEDLAATAIRGTQQLDALGPASRDGVFAAWYGKGPGVDRAGDALKHGNFAGAHRHGGVVLFYGDDHGGKSSSICHHSEQAMAANFIPSLYPANVGEIIEYGLLAYALSRYSGSWVGVKCVNEVVEQTTTVDLALRQFSPYLPLYENLPPEGVHVNATQLKPVRDEQIVIDYRLPLVERFVRANRIDRTIFRAAIPRLGIVTAGKTYADVRTALALLGLDESRAASLGISLLKVGCIWPLAREALHDFARSHEVLLVIEEKAAFLEPQVAATLINTPLRPLVIGKFNEHGAPLLSSSAQLDPHVIALCLAERLARLQIGDEHLQLARRQLATVRAQAFSVPKTLAPADVEGSGTAPFGIASDRPTSSTVPALPQRSPYFCSGCPHSRSTRIPEGSHSMTGIGCHTMVTFVRPDEALPPTHMGGEGANWIGLAPYTSTPHIFQNMGDGTYYHSGLIAIRAAVAAGVNITYKILYNDAVAMTGGQPIDGPLSVADIAHQVRHEGVKTVVLVSDQPARFRGNSNLPSDVRIVHRDELDAVQRELRETAGCTVLIYEQTCAAEKRRRRKRGHYPDPPKRLYIAPAVCEGCGDCSVQSTCVSLLPLETDLGTKRRIDQSSCNKDFSCIDGFCPSFITVYDAEPRKPKSARIDVAAFAKLPGPRQPEYEGSFNLIIAGIGGTGVITVSAIIAMAGHIDGLAASAFDMTGLAQKNGAVYSHVRIASSPAKLHAQRLSRGEADVLLAFDLVAALGAESVMTLRQGRSHAIVNTDVSPTAAFQFDRNESIGSTGFLDKLADYVAAGDIFTVPASSIATSALGDSIATNLFMVGMAVQRSLLPVSVTAVEQALQLNGVAVELNLTAFRLGRLYVADRARFSALVASRLGTRPAPETPTVDALISQRTEHLVKYQDQAYAARYRELVDRVAAAEQRLGSPAGELTQTVARNYAKLLAYKDEYEVARLLSDPALYAELKTQFADGARFAFNLAPPILAGKAANGRPRKRAMSAAMTLPLFRLLARLKGLRGTLWDPFGRTSERRSERALIAHYESLVGNVLLHLSTSNYRAAVQILALADQIRGFGPVKEAAISAYHAKVSTAERDLI